MRMRSHRVKLNMVAVVLALVCMMPTVLCACSSFPIVSSDIWSSITDIIAGVSNTDLDAKKQNETKQDDPKQQDVLQNDESGKEAPPVQSVSVVDITDSTYSYDAMERDLLALEKQYGELLSVVSIGASVDGRKLYAARLGAASAPLSIVVTAGIHAREFLSTSIVMGLLEYYLSNYETGSYGGKTYSELFSSCAVIVLPMLNPDGVVLCQEGVEGLRTKAAMQAITSVYNLDMAAGLLPSTYSINTYCRTCLKANVNGVDLNRNYPNGWETYRKMLQPSMKNYKGAAAASEPETQAVMTYLSSLSNVSALVAFHTQGEVIYWDCGQTGTLRQNTLRLAEEISKTNGYNCIDEQNNDASLTDWTVLSLGIPSVTIELGVGTKYPLDYAQAQDVFDANVNVWAAVAALYID